MHLTGAWILLAFGFVTIATLLLLLHLTKLGHLVHDHIPDRLNLRDVYWSREGRASIDVVVLFGSLLAMGAWGAPIWRHWFPKRD